MENILYLCSGNKIIMLIYGSDRYYIYYYVIIIVKRFVREDGSLFFFIPFNIYYIYMFSYANIFLYLCIVEVYFPYSNNIKL